jgi:hypothetical protein
VIIVARLLSDMSNVKCHMSNVELVLSNDPFTNLPNWVSW